ncbi:hypothetical protein C8J56DRAFT_1041038 [Mycena floridula]|nr:hypothetical protein C8J56DRAFT_1041038 [Mycena floridula]
MKFSSILLPCLAGIASAATIKRQDGPLCTFVFKSSIPADTAISAHNRLVYVWERYDLEGPDVSDNGDGTFTPVAGLSDTTHSAAQIRQIIETQWPNNWAWGAPVNETLKYDFFFVSAVC